MADQDEADQEAEAASAGPEPEANAIAKVDATVRLEDTAAFLSSITGDEFPAVLSTTKTIALLELAAGKLLTPLLKEGELSVGVDINVKHLAATPIGAKVHATARYTGKTGKLFNFEVVAYDAAGEIMRGEHTRAIIETQRLMKAAKRRNP
jgi:fluoroacetyl-CoA thioesterase